MAPVRPAKVFRQPDRHIPIGLVLPDDTDIRQPAKEIGEPSRPVMTLVKGRGEDPTKERFDHRTFDPLGVLRQNADQRPPEFFKVAGTFAAERIGIPD